MNDYAVRFEETSVLHIDIQANSPKEAMEIFEQRANDGKIDFSNMTVINSIISIE